MSINDWRAAVDAGTAVGANLIAANATAFMACARAHVDHPIARRHDPHVVLYHDHRVAGNDQAVELQHQLVDVGGVEPDRGSSST